MFGQTEPVTVPSKKILASCEFSSAETLEVGVYYTATQWALTFPNLRRHHTLSVLYHTFSVLPVASFLVHTVFMCNVQFFDSQQSIYINLRPLGFRSMCTCPTTLSSVFPQRYYNLARQP